MEVSGAKTNKTAKSEKPNNDLLDVEDVEVSGDENKQNSKSERRSGTKLRGRNREWHG